MINNGLFTSRSSEWSTPQDLFDKLDQEFHFNLDPCATKENAKGRLKFGGAVNSAPFPSAIVIMRNKN